MRAVESSERRNESLPKDDSVEEPVGSGRELTPRGARTRSALLEAARIVFERDGYLNARVSDITEEAGVSHGTFYTYFSDKEQVFEEVVAVLQSEFHDRRPPGPEGESLYEAIYRANKHYYETYVRRARLIGLVEQVATFSPEMLRLRREIRRRFVERSERSIRRWQSDGLVDAGLDAYHAASALGSMVDRSMYVWLVLGERHDPTLGVETLSRLWATALGFPVPPATAQGSGSSKPPATASRSTKGSRR